MRDPSRIPLILKALEKKWMSEPDMRLGQLVVNLSTIASKGVTSDPFYIEDDQIASVLEN